MILFFRSFSRLSLIARSRQAAMTAVLLPTVSLTASGHELEEIEVLGRRINLVGEAVSSSQGLVGPQEIRLRPLLRTGEILELVPGMIVTQHSGTGKANQYFLRGFNLDHGTDFATWVDGTPVNMRTHGHGQGYTDLNFIIPETVAQLEYRKGSHYSDQGDFSSVGSASMLTAERLDQGQLLASAGENGFLRLVALDSVAAADGEFVYALEMNRYDGPWRDIEEDVDKLNGLLKYTTEVGDGRLSVNFMGYKNSWNSADQIPARAVDQGLIDELGSLDTSVGGDSSRYSLSANFRHEKFSLTAYAIDYELDLWSNFTYLLDNPVNGDQFQQVDDRLIVGGQAEYRFGDGNISDSAGHRVGAELRYDMIDEVALYQSQNRRKRGAVRSDEVDELSLALFYEHERQWNHHVRTQVGARYDYFDFDVDSLIERNINGVDLSDNSGDDSDGLLSLNANLVYTFDEHWEAYASIGQGFHSNDARGTTTRIDPVEGGQVKPVDPLVQSLGGEIGGRAFWTDKLNASAALWYLELDSELLFVGDAGNTEANRASERIGLELSAYYYILENWTLDLEYAWTDAKFSERAPEGDQIPGSLEHVLQAGISFDYENSWFGSLRVRYFGERPLTEDGEVMSDSSSSVNLRLGYRWPRMELYADILNLTDSNDHDIDYYYASRLPGEPAEGIEDQHYHVLEPRTARVTLSWRF